MLRQKFRCCRDHEVTLGDTPAVDSGTPGRDADAVAAILNGSSYVESNGNGNGHVSPTGWMTDGAIRAWPAQSCRQAFVDLDPERHSCPSLTSS